MKFDRDLFEESFSLDHFPEWVCPTCNNGKLHVDKPFISQELVRSKNAHTEEDWEPESKHEKFYGDLVCNSKKCGEKVTIAGRIEYWLDEEMEEANKERLLQKKFYPEYFYPYLKLFALPIDFPFELEEPIETIFKLFWVDSSACANAIRIMVGEILTEQRINKTTKGRNKKRQYLNLHQRIENLKRKIKMWLKFF